MSARDVDPIIAAAQARLRVAADLIERGRDELRAVLRSLEQHPDFKRTERAGRRPGGHTAALTLAWWLHNGTHATLHDAELDDAPKLLWADTDERLAASMRLFMETEAADEAEFARKRVQTSVTKRPAAVQATA